MAKAAVKVEEKKDSFYKYIKTVSIALTVILIVFVFIGFLISFAEDNDSEDVRFNQKIEVNEVKAQEPVQQSHKTEEELTFEFVESTLKIMVPVTVIVAILGVIVNVFMKNNM
jgi:TRAP-type uncharacterized transport system fused permease subunit